MIHPQIKKASREATAWAVAVALIVPFSGTAFLSTALAGEDASANIMQSVPRDPVQTAQTIAGLQLDPALGASFVESALNAVGLNAGDLRGLDAETLALCTPAEAANIRALQGLFAAHALGEPEDETLNVEIPSEGDLDESTGGEAETPSLPGEETDATDPANPGDPLDPTSPADPTDPVNPADPADPSDPTVSPEQPDAGEVTDPSDDANATVPVVPAPSLTDDSATTGVLVSAAPSIPEGATTDEGEAVVSEEWLAVGGGAPSGAATMSVVTGASQENASAYPAWSYDGDATYIPRIQGLDLTTEKFIAVVGEPARKIAQESGLYASVMIAQAVLESGSGNSELAAAPNFNLFGIKGSTGWKGNGEGESVSMRTLEDAGDGTLYAVYADFRTYDSIADSLQDNADLLTNRMARYYRGALKENADEYQVACRFLQGRYATDTHYAEKLEAIIEAYDLTRYDEPLEYELENSYKVPVLDENGVMTIDLETGEYVYEERDLVDLVTEATSHLGDEYVWGGTTPGSFDCSGLVQYSYRTALGVQIPRTTYYQCLYGQDIDFADLNMGDLLFFADKNGVCVHVGMYLGEGCYIEAPQAGDVVRVTSLEEKPATFAKRLISTKLIEESIDSIEE